MGIYKQKKYGQVGSGVSPKRASKMQLRDVPQSKVIAKNCFKKSMFSRLVRDLVQKAKSPEILWRSRIQAIPF